MVRVLIGCSMLLAGCTLSAGGTSPLDAGQAEGPTGLESDAGIAPVEATPDDTGVTAPDGPDAGLPTLPSDDAGSPEIEPDAGIALDALRLDALQLKGSHKSYHVAPFLALPHRAFTHVALDVQLEQLGVRALELDVHERRGELAVYDSDVLDEGSTCGSLRDCLGLVAGWSTTHPAHLPVVIWLEARDAPGNEALFDDVIGAVFADASLVRPSDVQGSYGTLHAALQEHGWPAIGSLRGRVMFVLNGSDDLRKRYSHDFTHLDGRHMFVTATLAQRTSGFASVLRQEDPLDANALREALDAHLLVGSVLCRATDNDAACATRRDAAFANGPHFLFDAFPGQVDSRGYWLDMAAFGEARCHPLLAPAGCDAALLGE